MKSSNVHRARLEHAMTSRKEKKVGSTGFVDTKFSSGDSKKTWKSKQKCVEENNNVVDGLSKDLQMGCIVDAVRPPNICVETCVYEGSESESEGRQPDEDVYYTDDFEEDSSGEEGTIQMQPKSVKSETSNRPDGRTESEVKLSKSHSFMSSKPSVSGKSGRSSQYGSLPVPHTRRVNMSFSNERLREIERHNHILLNKILSARISGKSSIPPPAPDAPRAPRPPPAALNRKRQQQRINHDNMILLRKIQRAKSSACSVRR